MLDGLFGLHVKKLELEDWRTPERRDRRTVTFAVTLAPNRRGSWGVLPPWTGWDQLQDGGRLQTQIEVPCGVGLDGRRVRGVYINCLQSLALLFSILLF
jgi:hypothetical protein